MTTKDTRPDPVADAESKGSPSWRPDKVGDNIEGTVSGFTSYQNDERPEWGRSPVVHLRDAKINGQATSDGRARVFVFGTVLLSRMTDVSPKVGDTIRAEYLGTQRGNDGNVMNLFDVVNLTAPWG